MGILLALLALVCFCSVLGDPNEGEARLLWEEFFEWKSATYPEWATQNADVTTYNTLVEDYSIEGIKKKGDKCKEFVQR